VVGLQFDRRLALTIAGLIGLGIVWGWWTAPWAEVRSRGWAVLLVLGAAALQGAEIVWLLGFRSLAPLLTAWLIGFLLHRAFRVALRMRFRHTIS
jgi:hypothetical protein